MVVSQPSGGRSEAGAIIYGGGGVGGGGGSGGVERRGGVSDSAQQAGVTHYDESLAVSSGSTAHDAGVEGADLNDDGSDDDSVSIGGEPRELRFPDWRSCDTSVPIDVTLHHCFLKPLREQIAVVDRAGAALFLYGAVRLVQHLQRIKRVFLLDEGVDGEDGVGRSGDEAVERRQLLHPASPLDKVVTGECAAGYTKVHAVLLRLQSTCDALRRCWVDANAAVTPPPRDASLFLYDMSHFVNTLHAYINLQVSA